MDPESRNLILEKKDYLSKRIDLDRLRHSLEKHAIFTDAMLDDIYNFRTEYNLFVELTTRGPDALVKFRQVLRDAGYFEEACIFETSSPNPVKKRLCYRMNSVPVGYCFIINNVMFDKHSYRYGSDVDANALCYLFEKLGYRVECKKDLKAQEMLNCLQTFSKKDWSAVDSCVLFIMSHGDNSNNLDIIYGSDSKYVVKNEIYELFDNVNCVSLRFKPKMFFFQACRGDKEDYGVFSKVSADASNIMNIPSMSNMLAAHSSLPNHKSYRDHEKGTWFCQDLIQVFESGYLTQDLRTMLNTVAQNLESRVSDNQCKQVLHVDLYGMKADIYFSMKNVADICEIYDPRSSSTS